MGDGMAGIMVIFGIICIIYLVGTR